MKRCTKSLLLAVFLSIVFLTLQAVAQVDRITIAAGTDEDHALQAITNEQDAQKKLGMYQDFVQKFSSNPQAVAYGNWQIRRPINPRATLRKPSNTAIKRWPARRTISTSWSLRPTPHSRQRTIPS